MKMKIIIGLFFLVLIGGWFGYRTITTEILTDVSFIKNGERVCNTSGTECKFLEYSSDETFENTDEFIFFKFNSGDVHREISAGKVCDRMKVYGWRVPFLSWYRNIVWIEGCK